MDPQAYRYFNRETNTVTFDIDQNLPVRPPKGNSTGKPITIGLNSFNVVDFPSKAVYQYDVSISFIALHFTCHSHVVLDSDWKWRREARSHHERLGVEEGPAGSWSWLDIRRQQARLVIHSSHV